MSIPDNLARQMDFEEAKSGKRFAESSVNLAGMPELGGFLLMQGVTLAAHHCRPRISGRK